MRETQSLQPPVINVPARGEHTATVLFLHGLGGSALEFLPMVQGLRKDPQLAHVKFALPNAKVRPITVNHNMPMQAWYDIATLDLDAQQDEEGMLVSVDSINALIDHEIESGGLKDSSRIILGGLSQGGTISLLTGMVSDRKLGGVFVMSSRLALPQPRLKELLKPHLQSTPIFWGHGTADPLVRYSMAEVGTQFLRTEVGVPASDEGLTFKTYEGMVHCIWDEEIVDFKNWLIGRFGEATEGI